MVEKAPPWRPFMLYPHGSNTYSSMSAAGSRSAMPVSIVVCRAEMKSPPRANCAACAQTDNPSELGCAGLFTRTPVSHMWQHMWYSAGTQRTYSHALYKQQAMYVEQWTSAM